MSTYPHFYRFIYLHIYFYLETCSIFRNRGRITVDFSMYLFVLFSFTINKNSKTGDRKSRFDTTRRFIPPRSSTRTFLANRGSSQLFQTQSVPSSSEVAGKRTRFEISRKYTPFEPTPVVSQIKPSSSAFNFPQFTTNFDKSEDSMRNDEIFNLIEEDIPTTTLRNDATISSVPVTPQFGDLNENNEKDETLLSVNPFEVALNALKTSIYDIELTELDGKIPMEPNLRVEEEDTSNRIHVEDKIIPNNNENLLNAFEEMFDATTEANLKNIPPTTTIPSDDKVSTYTEMGPVTHVINDTIEDINNMEFISEANNLLFEDKINKLESVTNSIMDPINQIVDYDHTQKSMFELDQSSTAMPMEESTTVLIDSDISTTQATTTSMEDLTTILTLFEEDDRMAKEVNFGSGNIAANLELTGPKMNVATKTMSNGVHVIVAG